MLVLSVAQSLINSHLDDLVMDLKTEGHRVSWARSIADAEEKSAHQRSMTEKLQSTICYCFCLSFSQLVPADFHSQFHHNIVADDSDLPQGKGWSALTRQILEGKHRIPITIIEADDRVDSGMIYAHSPLGFQSHELNDELRAAQTAEHDLCRLLVDRYPDSAEQGPRQQGEENFHPSRPPPDSMLDADKTLAEHFALLRVVDNERYSALFDRRGKISNASFFVLRHHIMNC